MAAAATLAGARCSTILPVSRPKTVLVADADADSREQLADLLSERYRVVLTRDGLSTVKKVRLLLPSLIVCSTRLLGFGGIEVARQLRSHVVLSRIPIIMLSTSTDPADITAAMKVGVRRYMLRPFLPEIMFDVATRLVDGTDRTPQNA